MDPRDLFDLERIPDILHPLLQVERPWDALSALDRFCEELVDDQQGAVHPTAVVLGPVVLAQDAEIRAHAHVRGPAWIGPGAVVEHGAFIRDHAVIGPHAKVGHATEIKRSILLADAKAPHFNYVGDSVLGSGVNLGAGVKLANFRADGGKISIDGTSTGLRKLGAILGDDVSLGCNVVLNPGTIIGRDSLVYPGAVVGGRVPPQTIVKLRATLEHAEREV